jgi:hypothetical protein
MNIIQEFPIESQTTYLDKIAIATVKNIFKRTEKKYSYCEIGSYLGGSLTPFLIDDNCVDILSIDNRNRRQPDERGVKFDYVGITHQTMIDNILGHNLNIDKLRTFDGSINDYNGEEKFDLVFIDGEHTDYACFRDFIYCVKFLKYSSIVMFHDSNLIYKSLKIIKELLNRDKTEYKFIKVKNSTVSFIFFGEFIKYQNMFEIEENLEQFYINSENEILNEVIKNRVSFNVNYHINEIL